MFRKVCAVKLDPPMGELATVGDVLAMLGCYGVTLAFAWLLVWPV